jgi:hypothetical protein
MQPVVPGQEPGAVTGIPESRGAGPEAGPSLDGSASRQTTTTAGCTTITNR